VGFLDDFAANYEKISEGMERIQAATGDIEGALETRATRQAFQGDTRGYLETQAKKAIYNFVDDVTSPPERSRYSSPISNATAAESQRGAKAEAKPARTSRQAQRDTYDFDSSDEPYREPILDKIMDKFFLGAAVVAGSIGVISGYEALKTSAEIDYPRVRTAPSSPSPPMERHERKPQPERRSGDEADTRPPIESQSRELDWDQGWDEGVKLFDNIINLCEEEQKNGATDYSQTKTYARILELLENVGQGNDKSYLAIGQTTLEECASIDSSSRNIRRLAGTEQKKAIACGKSARLKRCIVKIQAAGQSAESPQPAKKKASGGKRKH
jgi:hypothetical protein